MELSPLPKDSWASPTCASCNSQFDRSSVVKVSSNLCGLRQSLGQGLGELSNHIHPLAQEEVQVPAARGESLRLLLPDLCLCPSCDAVRLAPVCLLPQRLTQFITAGPTEHGQSRCTLNQLCLKRTNICVRGPISLLGLWSEPCRSRKGLCWEGNS